MVNIAYAYKVDPDQPAHIYLIHGLKVDSEIALNKGVPG